MPILCVDLLESQRIFCGAALKSFLSVFLAPQNVCSYETDFHTGVCGISEYGTHLSTWISKKETFFLAFFSFLTEGT